MDQRLRSAFEVLDHFHHDLVGMDIVPPAEVGVYFGTEGPSAGTVLHFWKSIFRSKVLCAPEIVAAMRSNVLERVFRAACERLGRVAPINLAFHPFPGFQASEQAEEELLLSEWCYYELRDLLEGSCSPSRSEAEVERYCGWILGAWARQREEWRLLYRDLEERVESAISLYRYHGPGRDFVDEIYRLDIARESVDTN